MSAPTPTLPRQDSKPAKASVRLGDRVFAGVSTGAGIVILIVLAAVTVFLVTEAVPALTADPRELPGGTGLVDYIAPLLFGTVLAAVLALLLATPLSIGIALFISHYADRRLARSLGYVIDLLAAIPSIIYGAWGALVLAPYLVPSYQWLAEHASFLPVFAGPASSTGRTILTAGIVLAVMILPIITAICREIFLQTPLLHEEAALALGATRWEMIRMAVLPFGLPGIISASMLGLGRALGETMAVAMVLSPSSEVIFQLLTSQNSNTIASNIALNFPEAHGVGVNILLATGLMLFVVTLLVNMLARVIINSRKAFSGAN